MTSHVNLLVEAAKCGNASEVQRLLVNESDTFLALMQAAQEGHLDCLKLLAAVSKHINSDALFIAAGNGHVECVEYLISVSSPSDARNKALRMACYHGHLECVQLLIPVSDFSELNDPGGALEAAVVGGNQDCMEAVYDFCDAEKELNNMKRQYTQEMWGMLDQYHQHLLSQQQKEVLMGNISISSAQRLKKM